MVAIKSVAHFSDIGKSTRFYTEVVGCRHEARAYFHDPDGTVLEFIDLTSYSGARAGGRPI